VDLRFSSLTKTSKGAGPHIDDKLVLNNVPFIGVFFQAVWLGIDIGGKCLCKANASQTAADLCNAMGALECWSKYAEYMRTHP
jgi:hypothetical protein